MFLIYKAYTRNGGHGGVIFNWNEQKKNGEKGGSPNKKGHKMDFLMILRAKVANIAFVVVLEYPLLEWSSC